MNFVKITYYDSDNKLNKEVIVNLSGIKIIQKYYPDKLNPNIPYEILFNSSWRVPFTTKAEADNYFNYVMEKLRSIELKKEPW